MLRTGKHQVLVDDPVIRYKSVESLPGVGNVYGRRLRDAGFDTAEKVLEKYLSLNRNQSRFTLWLNLVCGANSHWAAQCFNGLNEWYLKWGKDTYPGKMKKSSSTLSIQNPLTNRMLLEQKILQFNFNSNDNRLRSLMQCQAMSLVDISSPQRALPEMLTKSHLNISSGIPYNDGVKTMQNEQCHSLASLMSPTQKCVNFKENEIIEMGTPRKYAVPTSPNRTISPILKSRSITPENKMTSYNLRKASGTKALNIPSDSTITPQKLNNLNINSNTYTRKAPAKPKETPSIRGLNMTNEKISKNNAPVNTATNRQRSYQNIAKYSDQEIKVNGNPRMSTPKGKSQKDSLYAVPIKSCELQKKDLMTDKLQRGTTVDRDVLQLQKTNCGGGKSEKESNCEKVSSFSDSYLSNSNEDSGVDINTAGLKAFPNESNASDDELSFGASTDLTDISVTENSEEQSRVLSPESIHQNDLSHPGIDLTDNSNMSKGNHENSDPKEENERSGTSFLESTSNFDNSNEDSGLDVNTNGLIEFPNDSDVTDDDDQSLTPFENIDSLSESSTDRTFEVNETTDAESAFNFVPSSLPVSAEELSNEVKDDKDTLGTTVDEAKRTNVRLFCDMLSSDLEQLPMDKFRKLKLKILQLVYAEIDECGLK